MANRKPDQNWDHIRYFLAVARTGTLSAAADERVLAGAEAIESAYVFAKAAASGEGQPISGTVRIGVPDGFGSVFLAPRLRALTERHPKLELEILVTATLFSLSK